MASKQVNAAHKEAVHSNIQEKKTKATHVQKNLIVDSIEMKYDDEIDAALVF
jgi:hypothetical protein